MNRILPVLIFILALAPVGASAQSTPLPDLTPLQSPTASAAPAYDFAGDKAYKICAAKDQDSAGFNPQDSFWASELIVCLAPHQGYSAIVALSPPVLKALNTRPIPLLEGVARSKDDAASAGQLYADLAMAFWHTGNAADARRYASAAYRELRQYGDMYECGSSCHDVHVVMYLVHPGQRAALAKQFAADTKRAGDALSAEVDKAESGMSADQKQVYENEGMELPCHKQVYDGGPDYYQVTWWYCKDNDDPHSGYRKAYTFLNGNLQSTYTP